MQLFTGSIQLGASVLIGSTVAVSAAEAYPEKGRTLNIVVPFAAGGASDILARLIGQKFGELWGVTPLIINKPGADMLIGSQEVSKAKKDGYTMGLVSVGIALNRVVRENFPFDPTKDFESFGTVGTSSYVLAVDQRSPYQSFKDLVTASQRAPGIFNYASCCTGTYIATEMLKESTKLKGLQIPFKGSTPAVNAMLGGETQYIMDTITTIKPFIDAGKLRALLVTGRERSRSLPDVPSLNDAKVPGDFQIAVWWGMVLPPGTPTPIVIEANTTLNKILTMSDVKQRIEVFNIDVMQSTPAEMAAMWRSDIEKYSKLARTTNLKFGN